MEIKTQRNICDALKEIRLRLDLSIDEMAKLLGYKGASSYQNYEDKEKYKKNVFENSLIQKLIDKLVPLGINEDEILSLGIGSPTKAKSSVEYLNRSSYSNGQFTLVRRVDSVEVSAGYGLANELVSDQDNEMVAFRTEWLRSITNTHPDNLMVITVRGESMQPTLHDGDNVLVDLTRQVPNDDGMYVVRYDGNLLVKRITVDPIRRELTISSDNKNYAPLKVYNASEVSVNGRVIWLGRRC